MIKKIILFIIVTVITFPLFAKTSVNWSFDEKNDELMNRLDRIIKTTHADYKKLLKDINTLYSWEKFKDYAKYKDPKFSWTSPVQLKELFLPHLKRIKLQMKKERKKL